MNLWITFFSFVFIQSVKSECSGVNCVNNFVNNFFDNKTNVDEVDVNIDLPKFEQIKNVEVSDLNKVLFQLTSWFESKLNQTNFMFRNVNNKTKIFVKTFDFNVDFEKGDVNIDVELSEKNVTNINSTEAEKNDTVDTKIDLSKPLEYKNKPIINIIEKSKGKEKENEIFNLEEFDTTYYDADEDNSTDYPILDYVDLYKDTTNEENVYNSTEVPFTDVDDVTVKVFSRNGFDDEIDEKNATGDGADPICIGDATCQDFTKSVYPWLATIFIKNDTHNNQFSYYCDGALLSERVIITDARCLYVSNKTLDPNNVLVFLGKGSLQSTGGNEKVVRIKEIIVHENFTAEGEVANDLALLVTEEPVEYTEAIQNACVREGDDDTGDTATTAWGVNGDLIPIFFNKEKSETCSNKDDNIFCATYGNNVPFCPSYGGVYAAKGAERWCLQGIFYGDPVERGICFTKDVFYTSLKNYTSWIDDVIELNKNDL